MRCGLRNRVVIGVHAGSFRTVRGRTLLAVVADEVSFWKDESSALPDVETYRACMPSLASTGGMWIGISTPYRRLGLLHQKHRDHFGQDGDDVLVVQGNSKAFNLMLDAMLIESAMAADPESALAEWQGEFRSDIAQFLGDELIDGAVDNGRPLELSPRSNLRYVAFVDPSGGRGDSSRFASATRKATASSPTWCAASTRRSIRRRSPLGMQRC